MFRADPRRLILLFAAAILCGGTGLLARADAWPAVIAPWLVGTGLLLAAAAPAALSRRASRPQAGIPPLPPHVSWTPNWPRRLRPDGAAVLPARPPSSDAVRSPDNSATDSRGEPAQVAAAAAHPDQTGDSGSGLAPAAPATAARAATPQRFLLENSALGIWQLDRAGRTLFGNAPLAALFGGTVPASLAAGGLRLAGPADPAGPLGFPAGRQVEATLAGPGRRRTVSVSASTWLAAEAGGVESCLLTLVDITPLKAAQARVEHLAEHDPLTGLANRAQFRGGLLALTQAPAGGALLLLNLDKFKAANDRHGHAAGDAVLCAVAERIRAVVRPSDMVCRLGADEFAVLAFDIALEAATVIADRLRAALAAPVRWGGAELTASASIGIAAAPDHAPAGGGPAGGRPTGCGNSADMLLRAAGLALRQAKDRSGNASCAFHPALGMATEAREALREALATALADNEFHLAYQPQRDMQTGRLAGAEALLRWTSPRLGRIVSPAELFPVAQEAGLMPGIDAWVLQAGLAQLAAWTGQPDAPPVLAINISGLTLRDAGFADCVARGLLRQGIDPARLEIEIPEDIAVRDLPGIAATLRALHGLGVRLALDDFGGGNSSLPHVVQLPVHRLKLDRSIVAGLPDEPKDRAVLHATMALARGMGIEVLGEGVETEGQAFALRRAGCTVLQGFLIGRPMLVDQLAERARA